MRAADERKGLAGHQPVSLLRTPLAASGAAFEMSRASSRTCGPLFEADCMSRPDRYTSVWLLPSSPSAGT